MKKPCKKGEKFEMNLMKVFCSATYLPVLGMGPKGIAGESSLAFAATPAPRSVPEPSTLVLFGAGVADIDIYAIIKRRKKYAPPVSARICQCIKLSEGGR